MIDDEMALRYSKIVKRYCEEHTCTSCTFYRSSTQDCAILRRTNKSAYQYDDEEERRLVQSIVMLDKYCKSQGEDDCGQCIFNKLTPGQPECPIVNPKNCI